MLHLCHQPHRYIVTQTQNYTSACICIALKKAENKKANGTKRGKLENFMACDCYIINSVFVCGCIHRTENEGVCVCIDVMMRKDKVRGFWFYFSVTANHNAKKKENFYRYSQ